MPDPSPRPKIPPDPRLISACTFWSPAPVGSFHGSRKVSSRSRRYGRRPGGDRGEPEDDPVRGGEHGARVPETSRIAPTTSRRVSAVPRSGSTSTSSAKTRTRSPIGLASSLSVRGGLRRERYAAVQTTRASFASSDGWKTSGPTVIQRRAPLIRGPTASTARQRTSAVTTRVGASARRRSKSSRETTTSSATPTSAYIACLSTMPSGLPLPSAADPEVAL